MHALAGLSRIFAPKGVDCKVIFANQFENRGFFVRWKSLESVHFRSAGQSAWQYPGNGVRHEAVEQESKSRVHRYG
jgi:hypothetical protein